MSAGEVSQRASEILPVPPLYHKKPLFSYPTIVSLREYRSEKDWQKISFLPPASLFLDYASWFGEGDQTACAYLV
jgi:hypothetical protein